MPNTPQGGKTLRETMIARFGSEEVWKEYLRNIGRKGGHNGDTGGFASSKELARAAGQRGGQISRKRRIDISQVSS